MRGTKDDMLTEDWTGGIYDNLTQIKIALWLLVVIEVVRVIV